MVSGPFILLIKTKCKLKSDSLASKSLCSLKKSNFLFLNNAIYFLGKTDNDLLPDSTTTAVASNSYDPTFGGRVYSEYLKWLEFTDWETKQDFDPTKFIVSVVSQLATAVKPIKTTSRNWDARNRANKLIIQEHFNKAFKFFCPRIFLKEVLTESYKHYTFIIWCKNKAYTRGNTCTCKFSMSCQWKRDFNLSEESLDEFINQRNIRGAPTFPQICVPKETEE